MRVDIRDAGAVSILRPLEIASYLRASDWKQSDVKEGQYAVWTRDDDVEAFLPLRTDTSDYALRMGDLLRVLSAVEDRSQTELLADLLTTNADVVRVRLIDDDLADGSMPIEEYTALPKRRETCCWPPRAPRSTRERSGQTASPIRL